MRPAYHTEIHVQRDCWGFFVRIESQNQSYSEFATSLLKISVPQRHRPYDTSVQAYRITAKRYLNKWFRTIDKYAKSEFKVNWDDDDIILGHAEPDESISKEEIDQYARQFNMSRNIAEKEIRKMRKKYGR